MTIVVEGELITVSDVVTGSSRQPVHGATILRAFDEQRRRLALEISATVGIGIGYDHLEVDPEVIAALSPTERILISARLLGRRRGGHEVAYVATTTAATPDGVRLLARARGWTQTPDAHAVRVAADNTGASR